VDLSFPHNWQAEILPERPIILPRRHFVYPRDAEEVERGALEVLVRPSEQQEQPAVEVHGLPLFRQKEVERMGHGASGERSVQPSQCPEPFLATCALGFSDPAVPTGIWSVPRPEQICAVSGGYAYLIDTTAPEQFTMVSYRPVLEVRPNTSEGLLLFVGHHSILAWGRSGQAWESEKLSSEGVTILGIEDGALRGLGWDLMTDTETAFVLDLRTGILIRQH
jgi:hypothetical protein